MKLGFARLLVFVAAWTLGTLAWASLWVQTQEIDFIGNRDATDRHWFYGPSTPNGGGQYPDVEWIFNANYLSTVNVVYVRGQSITFTTKLKNLHTTEVQGFFYIDNPRLEVPGGYNYRNPHSYPLVQSEPEYVMIPPGGTVTVTTTLDNVRTSSLMGTSGTARGLCRSAAPQPGRTSFRTLVR